MTQYTHHSELKLHQRCARAHHYKYEERIGAKRPQRPTFVGTIMHEMLEAWVKARIDEAYDNDPWKVLEKYKEQYRKLFQGERELFGDIPAMCAAIFEGYLRRWKGDGLKYLGAEVEMETEITPGRKFRFKIDKLVVDKHGRRFLVDHKFHKNIPGPEDRFSDIQTLLYFWAYNREVPKADHLDGVLWDYGRMKAPTIPEVLKSTGELSKAMKIDTDAWTYMQAIRANGLDPKKYQDMMIALKDKDKTFFERVYLPGPSKTLVFHVVNDAKERLQIIDFARGKHIAPRSQSGFNCNNCEWRKVCEAEVRGLDADFVRKKHYEDRDPHSHYKGERDGDED